MYLGGHASGCRDKEVRVTVGVLATAVCRQDIVLLQWQMPGCMATVGCRDAGPAGTVHCAAMCRHGFAGHLHAATPLQGMGQGSGTGLHQHLAPSGSNCVAVSWCEGLPGSLQAEMLSQEPMGKLPWGKWANR